MMQPGVEDTRNLQEALEDLDGSSIEQGSALRHRNTLSYPTTGPTIVDQAEAIIEELDDWIVLLKRAVQALRPLEPLRPPSGSGVPRWTTVKSLMFRKT